MTRRDSVAALDGAPAVVSLSDVHGHLDRARSALLTLSDHPDYAPIVERDGDGRLRWAGGDEYVLVFNGDLVDRGPESAACLELARRLQREAPDGHVRQHLGNHEWFCLLANPAGYDRWFCDRTDDAVRRRLLERLADGEISVAYRGHDRVYSHAGAPEGVDPAAANDAAGAAARRLLDGLGTIEDTREANTAVFDEYGVFDRGDANVKGPGAGPLWLDFRHLPADAPPQVVGHTRHETPTRKGDVICQDVILRNVDSPGGEAVLVETPESIRALARDPDGGVSVRTL